MPNCDDILALPALSRPGSAFRYWLAGESSQSRFLGLGLGWVGFWVLGVLGPIV